MNIKKEDLEAMNLQAFLRCVEKAYLERYLLAAEGCALRAAKLLQMSERTMHRKIRKHGMLEWLREKKNDH